MKLSVSSICVIASASLLIPGCNNMDCMDGSGNEVTKIRQVEPFTFVETSGSIKLVLKQGSQEVRIVADDNIMDEIETRVKGQSLIIEMDRDVCNNRPVTVYLSAQSYEGVSASGAVEIMSDGLLQVKDFEMELSGSSKVNLNLNASKVTTRSSGSSEIALKGQASNHEVDLSGSSSVKALNFVVGKYRIESSGASESKINVLSELHVKSSGSSDIEYRGNPAKVSNDESGASSIRQIK